MFQSVLESNSRGARIGAPNTSNESPEVGAEALAGSRLVDLNGAHFLNQKSLGEVSNLKNQAERGPQESGSQFQVAENFSENYLIDKIVGSTVDSIQTTISNLSSEEARNNFQTIPSTSNNLSVLTGAQSSQNFTEPEPIYMQHMTTILVILHLSVFVTGLIGNALVCLSVYRNKTLQTVTNYYIVNLAVADFLVILICLPPTVYWDLNLTWNFGLILCKLVLYLQNISVSVSVLTLTCISIDRWYAICRPLEFCSTKSRAKITICLIWFASMLFASPDVIFLTTRQLYEENGYVYTDCLYDWPEINTKLYQLSIAILLFVGPFVLMSISYSHIVNVLWRNEALEDPAKGPRSASNQEQNLQHLEQLNREAHGQQGDRNLQVELRPQAEDRQLGVAATLESQPNAGSGLENKSCLRQAQAGPDCNRLIDRDESRSGLAPLAGVKQIAANGIIGQPEARMPILSSGGQEFGGRASMNARASVGATVTWPNSTEASERTNRPSASDIDRRPATSGGLSAEQNSRSLLGSGANNRWRCDVNGDRAPLSELINVEIRLDDERQAPPMNHHETKLPSGDSTLPVPAERDGAGTGSACNRRRCTNIDLGADNLAPASDNCPRRATSPPNCLVLSDRAAARQKPEVACCRPAMERGHFYCSNGDNETTKRCLHNKETGQSVRSKNSLRSCCLSGNRNSACCCLLSCLLNNRKCPANKQDDNNPIRAKSNHDADLSKRYRKNLKNYAAASEEARRRQLGGKQICFANKQANFHTPLGLSQVQAAAPSTRRLEAPEVGAQGAQLQNGRASLRGGANRTTSASHEQQKQQQQQLYAMVASANDMRFYKLIESRKKAAKMLIVIVIMFGLCYLPIHFLNILRYTMGLPQNDFTTIASLVTHWLCYFNSAVNPLIYNLMSGGQRTLD